MWSYSRRLVLLAPLALIACGFTPLYGPAGEASGLQGAVRAEDPVDKAGFDLVRHLEARLGRPTAPRFDLAYTIQTAARGVGVTADGATTRYTLVGSVDYTLTDRSSGAVLTSGTVDSFTAYSATGSTIAGLSAAQDAQDRLMRILAERIASRLEAGAADLPR